MYYKSSKISPVLCFVVVVVVVVVFLGASEKNTFSGNKMFYSFTADWKNSQHSLRNVFDNSLRSLHKLD